MSEQVESKPVTQILPNLNTYTYLPVTESQFETLTNELLAHMNQRTAPNSMEPKFFAQVLIRAIHGADIKAAKLRKEELFDACLVRISRNLTFNIGEALAKDMKAGEDPQHGEVLPEEVSGIPTEAPAVTP